MKVDLLLKRLTFKGITFKERSARAHVNSIEPRVTMDFVFFCFFLSSFSPFFSSQLEVKAMPLVKNPNFWKVKEKERK